MKVKTFEYADRGNTAIGVSLGDLDIYFSYQTPIAFCHPKTGLVIRENDWKSTTGGHLNSINDDKSVRIPSVKFEEQLEKLLSHSAAPVAAAMMG